MNDRYVYYIIHPRGDKNKIDVLEYWTGACDIYDYSIASRHTFTEEQEAIDYAKQLAKRHSIQYVGRNNAGDKHNYLD